VPILFDGQLLGGSTNWRATLEEAIAGCSCVIYFASPASWGSETCADEILRAQALGKPCLPFFLEPVRSLYGGMLNPQYSHAFAAVQYTDLCSFPDDAWVFPAALLLTQCGVPGLEAYAQDPRASVAPTPHDGLGAWHLGVMMTWDRAVLAQAVVRCRRRLESGALQADVDMGLGLCLLALKTDMPEARRRFEAARSYFSDVAQAHFYAALAICAYQPIGQLAKADVRAALDRVDTALSLVPDYRAALFLRAALQYEYAAAHRLQENGPRSARDLLAEAAHAPEDAWEMAGLARILVLREPALSERLRQLGQGPMAS
jgi:hypothetical protein